LSWNPAFEILWGSRYMHDAHFARLVKVIPALRDLRQDYPFYPEVGPSSFWFRRKKNQANLK